MIRLPNTTYVELYSEMAEAVLVESQGGLIDIYVEEENGDQRFTEEAQDIFEEYSSLVEGVLEGVGIGQDYDLAATENMVVVNADPNIDTLASSDLEMNVLQVAIDHMIEHLEDVSYCVDDGMYAEDVAKQIRLEDEGRLEAAKRLKERFA
jgi:hypothetical protein